MNSIVNESTCMLLQKVWCDIVLRSAVIIYWLWIWVWHVGGCGVCVVGTMAKDIYSDNNP